MKYYRLIINIIMLLTGCSGMWLINPINPTLEDVSIPALNDAITTNLGDELLVQGVNAVTKCINIKEDNKDKTVKAGKYVLSSTFNNREVYEVVPLSGAYLAGYLLVPPQGMKLFYKEETLCSGFINYYGSVVCREPNIPSYLYDFQSCTVSRFIETLIYTGRDGNILKFLYIKYAGDIIRPVFTTQIFYDLREGSDIAIKSAKLKIIEATNEQITYIVVKNFN